MSNYLNNDEMLTVWLDAKEQNKCTEQLGEVFMVLATKLSKSRRFCGYTYIDMMVSNALYKMVRYWDRFNPERGKMFSYFTQIAWYAFLEHMRVEKKHQLIRDSLLIAHGVLPSFAAQEKGVL